MGEKISSTYKCYYCGLENKKVEAQGMWHCPNGLCDGPGGAWFRRTLKSYEENSSGKHTICTKERAREWNKILCKKWFENVLKWFSK